ncbi:larval cuticle protein LCP-17-like [Eupeodes corollae]|uniref:larval cuticle protein LCP-17-like n=1 Tax=Eupeodes corollae TaxID=290404 RepID=UPI002493963E|nr:larval cuticle protein LCP-17-like [Eupeodes corollae]
MKFVPILCLLFFVVAKAEESQFDESENGQAALDSGNSFLELINPGHSGNPISGRFVYSGEDGQQYDVSYFADVYGYQAQGRPVLSSHPVARFLNKQWKTRITLEGKYGLISDED